MNRELESLILAYEAVSAARDTEAESAWRLLRRSWMTCCIGHPGVSHEILRKSIIKAHRQWALKQAQKPPAIPPKA